MSAIIQKFEILDRDKPTKILKDVDESANLIDDEDFYPSFRPSIDCDVLNSVIVEENEDIQSLSGSVVLLDDTTNQMTASENASEVEPIKSRALESPPMNVKEHTDDVQTDATETNLEDSGKMEKVDSNKVLITSPQNDDDKDMKNHNDDEKIDHRQMIKFSVKSRCLISDDNVGKETDVDDEDEELTDTEADKSRQIANDQVYRSTLVTTCVDSDEEIIENYDLKVPNESWPEYKSSLDRPQPVGCSSDSPSGCSSSSGPDKDHYDSLEDEDEVTTVTVPQREGRKVSQILKKKKVYF